MAVELYRHPLFSDANLVSYYRMESNANDEKSVVNGTETAITHNAANGKFGSGAGFNGTSSKISFADNASWEIAAGTMMFWWTPSVNKSGARSTEYIIDKGNTYWGVRVHTDSTLQFLLYDGSVHEAFTTQSSWTAGTFYHLTFSWGAAGMKIYVNGTKDGTNAHTGSYSNTADNWFLMNNAAAFSAGSIDDMGLFSRQLSDSEVSSFYNYGGFFLMF